MFESKRVERNSKNKYNTCKYKLQETRVVALISDMLGFTENQKTKHKRKRYTDKG